MDDIALDLMLYPDAPPAHEDVRAWWLDHVGQLPGRSPFEAAVAGGARADRLGWAFGAGYSAALTTLMPGRSPVRRAALCVTETGGVHPRAIETVYADGRLTGEKVFVTFGTLAEDLFVLARAGQRDDGRPSLVLVSIAPDAAGVTLEALPPTPFVPEIPHASVRFDGARAEPLAGDGWSDFVRPFRTVEDIFVHAAAVSFLGATAVRLGWDKGHVERAAALLLTLEGLAELDPSAASTHLALAGAIETSARLFAGCESEWDDAPEPQRERWRRDRTLLRIASKAREARRLKAWAR